MKLEPQITFRNAPASPDIEAKILTEVTRLEEHKNSIISCRVVVDVPHRHHKDGNLYEVRIDLKVPGAEIAVNREPAEHTEYRDIDIAIRDAFDEARRQLEDRARVKRGDVKFHEPMPHAKVVRIAADGNFGFLETPDGREIYFHKNSVLDGKFRDLVVGSEVRFVEELGEKGPQASTVHPVGRHSGL